MPRVDDYGFGRIVIDGKAYNHDVILFWDGKIEKWWRKEGHKVYLEDVKMILERKPEVVVFGTGKYGVMNVRDEVRRKIEDEGIEVIELISDEAVKKFNELVEDRKAVLAIHLTC